MSEDEALVLEDNSIARLVYGQNDCNLRALEEEIGVQIRARGNRVRVVGDELSCKVARRALRDLYDMAAAGVAIHAEEARQMVRMTEDTNSHARNALVQGQIVEVGRRKRIVPRSANQRRYIETIAREDLVFGIGPAGTGKTYLAMAMAVSALQHRAVARIILTRPAVEAGEKLGYLPGTLYDKVDPYLRPLYDALHDMLDSADIARRSERGVIEVAPLAFMRGRTLNDAFIILDEAQNTTSEQMRMFLTRLGFDSKAVITGDVTQIDLPRDSVSGLVEARRVLRDIPGIEFVEFNEKDVVRHQLVQQIILAYEGVESRKQEGR